MERLGFSQKWLAKPLSLNFKQLKHSITHLKIKGIVLIQIKNQKKNLEEVKEEQTKFGLCLRNLKKKSPYVKIRETQRFIK